jgi:hypothetical protein
MPLKLTRAEYDAVMDTLEFDVECREELLHNGELHFETAAEREAYEATFADLKNAIRKLYDANREITPDS